jgi:hypothetical protein
LSRRLLTAIAAALLLLLGTAAAASAAPGDLTMTLPGGDQGDDRTPLIAGTGDPAYAVHVLVNGVEAAAVTPAADGTWSYQLTADLPQGEQATFDAEVRDAFGGVLAQTVVYYYVFPPLPTVSIVEPAPGGTIGHSFGVRAQVEGDVSYAFEVLLDGAAIDDIAGDGSGSLEGSLYVDDLASGPHTLQIRGTNESGRTVLSAPVTVVADVTAPAKPTLVSPAPGSTVRTLTPVFHGTGTPGDTIRLQFAGSGEPVIDDVTVGADGTWSAPTRIYPVEPKNPFAWGAPYRTMLLQLIESDPAGNRSFVDLTLVLDVRPAAPAPANPPADPPSQAPAADPASAVPGAAGAPELANTGANTAPGLLTALLLIAVGLGLGATSRRLSHR